MHQVPVDPPERWDLLDQPVRWVFVVLMENVVVMVPPVLPVFVALTVYPDPPAHPVLLDDPDQQVSLDLLAAREILVNLV